MKNDKMTALIALLAIAMIFFFVITEAFHLISAPSDVSVFIGVILLCLSLFAIFKLTVFAFKKLF